MRRNGSRFDFARLARSERRNIAGRTAKRRALNEDGILPAAVIIAGALLIADPVGFRGIESVLYVLFGISFSAQVYLVLDAFFA
jgi:hypothetical protein